MKQHLVPQGQRAHSLVGSLLSAGALVMAVVAVPVVLVSEGGSPLPSGGVHRFRLLLLSHQGFDVHIATSWLVHGALLLAWAAWVWMFVCVLIEFRSWATGRSSTRLPGSRTMQAMAACLVGTSLALISMGRILPTPTLGQRASTSASFACSPSMLNLRVIDDYGFGLGESTADGASSSGVGLAPLQEPLSRATTTGPPEDLTAEAEGTKTPECTHTVTGRETLWSIAEARLGSARRWRELAALNYSVPQLDGGMLSKTHWIEPGWNLILPPTSATSSALSANQEEAVLTSGTSTLDPDPTSTRPGPAAPEFVTTEVETKASTGWIAGVERGGEAPLPLVGAALLGAGVVTLLERMRRTQQRRRVEGGLIRLPDAKRTHMERRLRRGDGKSTADSVDVALKLFTRVCVGQGGPPPLVHGVEVHADGIELILDRTMDRGAIPHPFECRAGRPSVFIANTELQETQDDANAPFPILVTVGNGADGPQLINMEAVGSLALVGDALACDGVVRALALEMATSHWAGQFDLVLFGFGDELARFDRVGAVSDMGTLLHRLHYRRLNGEALLRSSSFGSFSHARMFEDSDTWDPLVVVCGPGTGVDDFAELVAIASDPCTGTAIIAPGPGLVTSQLWDISSGERSSSLEMFSSVVFPQTVSSAELADVGALVDTATDCEPVSVNAHPYGAMSIPMPSQHQEHLPPNDKDTARLDAVGGNNQATQCRERRIDNAIDVEVAVLGPVEVRGAEHQFTRAWAEELVIYLAMHPHGASNDAWATALWPDRLMASSSLHSTASVARRSLGHAQDGQDHLPKAHGRLRLAESVGTDWAQFVRLADTQGAGHWQEALELVRGRPFEGLRASDWPILEGIAPAMEATIVDVAGRLAGAYLHEGNPSGAEWAARKGLLVSPYDERLYRMLLRVADRAGNPAGVESVMSELIRVVADEVEPFDSVHPSTMELYRSLSRRKTLATVPH